MGIFTILVFAFSLGIGALSKGLGINVGFLLMFSPRTAAVLTKLITKEKPKDMSELYIVTNFRKSKKIYLLALAFGVIQDLTAGIAGMIVLGSKYDAGSYILSKDSRDSISMIPLMLAESVFLIAIFLGEEYGWRAFLTPKLKKLMPDWAAYIVSGIIWGMWHKPVLDEGQNFGKELPFFPFSNYALMCVGCILTGIVFTWLTEKSGSVFPAAFAHAALDLFTSLAAIFVPADLLEEGSNIVVFSTAVLIVTPLIIIIAYALFGKCLRATICRGSAPAPRWGETARTSKLALKKRFPPDPLP